jgi:hypothetical protein
MLKQLPGITVASRQFKVFETVVTVVECWNWRANLVPALGKSKANLAVQSSNCNSRDTENKSPSGVADPSQ